MKTAQLNRVSNKRIAPGAKRCVHEKGLTAVVSENDSVYLYSGGKEEPLRILAFNPKTGQATYIDEQGSRRGFFIQQVGLLSAAKQIYKQGLQLLAAAHYSPPQSKEKKLQEWLQDLWDRPRIEREELKGGHRLVASIWKHPSGPNARIHARCCMLGDCLDTDNKDEPCFQIEKDPDLDQGIIAWENDMHRVEVIQKGKEKFKPTSKDVQLKREDARFLRELLPPYQAQRFLNAHMEMLNSAGPEAEAAKEERSRRILRGAGRAGGKTDPFGTVAI